MQACKVAYFALTADYDPPRILVVDDDDDEEEDGGRKNVL